MNQLYQLGLTEEQILAQDFSELNDSLKRVNDAMSQPDSFGTFKIATQTNRWRIRKRQDGWELTRMGIMPILLGAKVLIETRLEEVRPIRLPKVGPDSVGKGLAMASAAAFAVLFTAYYEFYVALGIEPEDIGINYAYVLARSIGLGLVVLGFVVYLANVLLVQAFRAARRRRLGRPQPKVRAKVRIAAFLIAGVGSPIALWLIGDFSAIYVGGVVAIVLVAALSIVVLATKREVPDRLEAGSNIGCVVLGMAVVLSLYAHQLGEDVRLGSYARPLSVLGVPLLDVHARPVEVQWVGPPNQIPLGIFPDQNEYDRQHRIPNWICAIDLGRNASTQFLVGLKAFWVGPDGDVTTSRPTLPETTPVPEGSVSSAAETGTVGVKPTSTSRISRAPSPAPTPAQANSSAGAAPDFYGGDGSVLHLPVAMIAVREIYEGNECNE